VFNVYWLCLEICNLLCAFLVTVQCAAHCSSFGNYKIFQMTATFRLCAADKFNMDKWVMSFWNKFNEGGCSHPYGRTDGRTYSCEQSSWVRSSGWTVTNIWADVSCTDRNRHTPWLGVCSVCVCHKLTVACLSTATLPQVVYWARWVQFTPSYYFQDTF